MSSKIDQFNYSLHGKVAILVLTNSKLDSSYPTNQFLIEAYSKPFRFYRNCNGGDILYIREDILCKERTKTAQASTRYSRNIS